MGPRRHATDHPGGVDLYVGGVEHAVLHLLYARFWHKVLYDLGHVSTKEPFGRLFNQGYIQAAAYQDERGIYVDGRRRSSERRRTASPTRASRSRGVRQDGQDAQERRSPDDMFESTAPTRCGSTRCPWARSTRRRPWETRDVVGMYRFLQRLWRNLVDENTGECTVVDTPADDDTRKLLHRTIDVVRTEMDALRFNTAIAKLIELNNAVTKLDATPREVAEPMVLMAGAARTAHRRGAVAQAGPRPTP